MAVTHSGIIPVERNTSRGKGGKEGKREGCKDAMMPSTKLSFKLTELVDKKAAYMMSNKS